MFVGCLSSQQHASVSQGRICTDNFTCCHTETEAANQTFHLTQSQYTDTGPTSPSADPITPGAWQGSHWSANFEVTGMTRPRKNPGASGIRTRDLPLSRRTPQPLGQRGGVCGRKKKGGLFGTMTADLCRAALMEGWIQLTCLGVSENLTRTKRDRGHKSYLTIHR